MRIYAVRDREAGNIIEMTFTREAAEEILNSFEENDKADGIFQEDFYEIAVAEIEASDFREVEDE